MIKTAFGRTDQGKLTTDQAMPTVLIVEDEAKMRRLLELNLAEEGYTILTAADAEAGLNTLRQEKIDLIVTDLKLPGMNGLEFLHAEAHQCHAAGGGDHGVWNRRNRR
jgi:CheY-like chemotaxis protein